jgi:hypothetical protein
LRADVRLVQNPGFELEPARDVEGEHGRIGERLDQPCDLAARCAALAVAERGVDHERGVRQPVVRTEIDGDADRSQARVLTLGNRREPLGRSAEPHLDVGAGDHEVAGGGHATAAVAAVAGDHEHALAAGVAAEQPSCEHRQRAAGVLHHLLERDRELVDHQPVDLAHLGHR